MLTPALLEALYGRRIELVETEQGPVLVPREVS